MRVAIVSEFYPRVEDPVLGVWAHRQALAARDAGADVRVFVLHRLVPAKADVAGGPRRAVRSLAAKALQPRHAALDEARAFLATRPYLPRDEADRTLKTLR